MSAFETLRPIMEKYIVEPDSLQTAFEQSRPPDLFSLGMDSMGAFALLDDLAAEGAVIELPSWWRTRPWSSSPPAWAKVTAPRVPACRECRRRPGVFATRLVFSLRRFYAVLCSCVYPCQRTSASVKRRGSSLPFTHRISSLIQTPVPDL